MLAFAPPSPNPLTALKVNAVFAEKLPDEPAAQLIAAAPEAPNTGARVRVNLLEAAEVALELPLPFWPVALKVIQVYRAARRDGHTAGIACKPQDSLCSGKRASREKSCGDGGAAGPPRGGACSEDISTGMVLRVGLILSQTPTNLVYYAYCDQA